MLKEKNEENIDLLKKYVDKADTVLKDYKKNINWSDSSYSYLFPLNYESALISGDFITSNNVNGLFISSGFCLPLDNNQYKRDLEEYSQKIFTYKAIMHPIDQLYLEIKKVENLEAEYGKKDSKYIEILGIFSSIIIFASAAFNVSLDLGNKLDLRNIVLIFISIGIVLILFLILVLLIARFSFRKMEIFLFNIKSRGWILTVCTIGFYLLFFLLIHKLVDVLIFVLDQVEILNILKIAN